MPGLAPLVTTFNTTPQVHGVVLTGWSLQFMKIGNCFLEDRLCSPKDDWAVEVSMPCCQIEKINWIIMHDKCQWEPSYWPCKVMTFLASQFSHTKPLDLSTLKHIEACRGSDKPTRVQTSVQWVPNQPGSPWRWATFFTEGPFRTWCHPLGWSCVFRGSSTDLHLGARNTSPMKAAMIEWLSVLKSFLSFI